MNTAASGVHSETFMMMTFPWTASPISLITRLGTSKTYSDRCPVLEIAG